MNHVLRSRTNRLGLEIALLVLVKLALLTIVWLLWFSKPVAPHMRVEPQRIAQHFFGRPIVTPSPGSKP